MRSKSTRQGSASDQSSAQHGFVAEGKNAFVEEGVFANLGFWKFAVNDQRATLGVDNHSIASLIYCMCVGIGDIFK